MSPEKADRTRPGKTALEARELSRARWDDFERFFRRYHGVQAGCWCMFYHRSGPTGPLGSATRQEANRRDHRTLLEAGHANGILVYRGAQPVGWCQFGRRDDLPRVEHGRKYRALATGLGGPPNWRITCFFVGKPLRRTGIAQFALHAALEAIRRRGGGVVEGYPATHGHAVAMWFGTVAMFEREGFTTVRPYGRSNVLVRREIRGAGGTRGTGAARKTGTRRRSTDERGRPGALPRERPRP